VTIVHSQETTDKENAAMTALWFTQALLPDGWAANVRVEIEADRLLTVTPGAARQTGDECHHVALPGLCNVHSHAFQRVMAGLAEIPGRAGDTFWTWREIMYRFAQRLDPDQLGAVAAMAYVEMLESGFTRVGEFHYLHHERNGHAYANPAELGLRIADAARRAGIGLTLLPVLYMASDFGGAPPRDDQRRFINTVDSYARLHEGLRSALAPMGMKVGVAPHSLRAVTPDGLSAAVALAGPAPIHIHIAEQIGEVESSIAWSGQRPVEWLLDRQPVDQRWCLVHATHVTSQENAAIAATGAVIGLCPLTEANLGDGIFPAAEFVAAGGRFGIGSDSNVLIDAASELMMLEYSQRLATRRRNVLSGPAPGSTGRALFDAARVGGNQALAISGDGLRAGAAADIISLRNDHPTLTARAGDALLDGWIFGGGKAMVDCVWANGKVCVVEGRHQARTAVAARYREVLRDLLA
jgi:formiminoglutamate deiminase